MQPRIPLPRVCAVRDDLRRALGLATRIDGTRAPARIEMTAANRRRGVFASSIPPETEVRDTSWLFHLGLKCFSVAVSPGLQSCRSGCSVPKRPGLRDAKCCAGLRASRGCRLPTEPSIVIEQKARGTPGSPGLFSHQCTPIPQFSLSQITLMFADADPEVVTGG